MPWRWPVGHYALAVLHGREPVVWLAALGIGALAAAGSVLFRLGINAAQLLWLGTMSERVASAARDAPWPAVLLAPVAGGLIVGILLALVPGRRPGGPADVIEAQAFGMERLGLRGGLLSAVVAAISLGSGGSGGREGPVVHLGACLAAAVTRRLRINDSQGRALLAAGVAAAISASFNAPIAGVLFAHEVVLGRLSATALAPTAIAAAIAAIIGRQVFGEFPAFIVPEFRIASYWELPAFAILGLVAAGVAAFFQLSVTAAAHVAGRLPVPPWLRPAAGGVLVGALGVFFPVILGVGYDTTDAALSQSIPFALLVGLVFLKTASTAITLGFGFGGGVFSPALYLGAMTGGAYGIVAASVFPDLASSGTVYVILGMGAVAAAVLGAPVSTTVMVFELTGGYTMSIALLLTVSIASAGARALVGGSFFHRQLAARGVTVADGWQR
jgi:CIC family chloride channel protein